MECTRCVPRKPWDIPFVAEPREVPALRRIMRLHLGLWGLCEVSEAAQLCVTELVSNVITHVGSGTPATLAVSMNGTHLRIEVHDPDARALPTLVQAAADSEGGRGMALVDAVADRWGVLLHPDRKVTWCELSTQLSSSDGHSGGTRVARAGAMLGFYGMAQSSRATAPSMLSVAVAEEVAIDVIADLLHWLQAHGRDVDEALDRAQMHFETELGTGGE
ncbi:ATP-binding protein [Streptomyces rhizosphaerihabitans]|uniref:ATP-binding protein n=1 Tax=Streptomyces rhizosphaerihabitans TaxID=1266770 RepID=UPI0021C02069|nr:ATP-binding protein [Streptomyces rhizosphaerihabitans]MCT9005230.1 ATP-binding protein [Streptomyces rhizosphaerihabitans]